MKTFTRMATGTLLLAFVIATGSVPTRQGLSGLSARTSVQELAFDNFISEHISSYRENMKDPIFFSPNFNFTLNSTAGNTGNVSTEATYLHDIRSFTARVNSSIDLANRVGNMRIEITLGPINITGSYHLEGVASSVIIVNGTGPYFIQTLEATWSQEAALVMNSSGYARLIWESPTLVGNTSPNSTFEGIIGEELIGEFIQDYLASIGDSIFQRVQDATQNNLSGLLDVYISNILQTITIEEILYGNTITTTTPPISTTLNPFPSSTMRPDVVVDVGADLAGSGWIIPTVLACGYATDLNGFFCNGDPVLIRDPFNSTGFWMSPCQGRCTFHYDNVLNGNSFQNLGFRAYYSDLLAGSKILVDFEHSSGTTHLEFFKSGGEYNEIDFSQYGILRNINVTMENGGSGHFAVLDRLSMTFN